MYCNKCGSYVDSRNRFCPGCGNDLGKALVASLHKKNVRKVTSTKKKKTKSIWEWLVIAFGMLVIILSAMLILVEEFKTIDFLSESEMTQLCSLKEDANCISFKVDNNYNPLDFSTVSYTNITNKELYIKEVIANLNQRGERSKQICDNPTIVKIAEELQKKAGISIVHICEMDEVIAQKLAERIVEFVEFLPILYSYPNAYIMGVGSFGEYANFLPIQYKKNTTYTTLMSRIFFSNTYFQDYDKLLKVYERDVTLNHHPQGTKPEDILIHETAHALNYYLELKRLNIDPWAISDSTQISKLITSWNNQTYAKDVVNRAYERICQERRKQNLPVLTLQDLQKEISNYAIAKDKNGNILYGETFAEAMTDYFVNRENAKQLSKAIFEEMLNDFPGGNE